MKILSISDGSTPVSGVLLVVLIRPPTLVGLRSLSLHLQVKQHHVTVSHQSHAALSTALVCLAEASGGATAVSLFSLPTGGLLHSAVLPVKTSKSRISCILNPSVGCVCVTSDPPYLFSLPISPSHVPQLPPGPLSLPNGLEWGGAPRSDLRAVTGDGLVVTAEGHFEETVSAGGGEGGGGGGMTSKERLDVELKVRGRGGGEQCWVAP